MIACAVSPAAMFANCRNLVPLVYEESQSWLPSWLKQVCPRPFLAALVQAAAADSVQPPASHVVSGIVKLPFAVFMAELSCVVIEYPLPAFVETTRSWQPI